MSRFTYFVLPESRAGYTGPLAGFAFQAGVCAVPNDVADTVGRILERFHSCTRSATDPLDPAARRALNAQMVRRIEAGLPLPPPREEAVTLDEDDEPMIVVRDPSLATAIDPLADAADEDSVVVPDFGDDHGDAARALPPEKERWAADGRPSAQNKAAAKKPGRRKSA